MVAVKKQKKQKKSTSIKPQQNTKNRIIYGDYCACMVRAKPFLLITIIKINHESSCSFIVGVVDGISERYNKSILNFLYAGLKNGCIMPWQCPSVRLFVRLRFPDLFQHALRNQFETWCIH